MPSAATSCINASTCRVLASASAALGSALKLNSVLSCHTFDSSPPASVYGRFLAVGNRHIMPCWPSVYSKRPAEAE
jgi:hypothetical protein